MKKQNYLCVDVKTYTRETLTEHHALFGMMEMTEQDEQFEFQEVRLPQHIRPDVRNPKLYDGPFVSLVRKRNGTYQFHVRVLDALPKSPAEQLSYVRALRADVLRALRSDER